MLSHNNAFQYSIFINIYKVSYFISFQSEWAVERGLLGGMIWSIETDDFRGDCGGGAYPLLSVIHKVMSEV